MIFSTRTGFGTAPVIAAAPGAPGGAGAPAANALSILRARLKTAGRQILDLSVSNPTAVGLLHDPALLARAFGDPGNNRYDPDPRGIRRAREAIAAHVWGAAHASQAAGAALDPDKIYLCASTSEAYGWLFKLLCDPGDAVLVPRPGYPLFDHLAGLESVRAVGYPQEYAHPAGWRIDVQALRDLLRAPGGDRIRAIVLINPNNPTGAYVRESDRSEILELCARAGLAVIADEVFFGFPLRDGQPRRSFLGEEAVLTFVLDGLSKRLCLPQAKLGWIAVSGPAEEVARAQARLDIIADAYLSAGTPVMRALPVLLAQEACLVAGVRARMAENLDTYRTALEHAASPHRVLTCEGGWTALLESPRFAGEEEIALRLLDEEGVFAQPGYFFDMDREPHFAASLIIEPDRAREGIGAYLRLFGRLSLS